MYTVYSKIIIVSIDFFFNGNCHFFHLIFQGNSLLGHITEKILNVPSNAKHMPEVLLELAMHGVKSYLLIWKQQI